MHHCCQSTCAILHKTSGSAHGQVWSRLCKQSCAEIQLYRHYFFERKLSFYTSILLLYWQCIKFCSCVSSLLIWTVMLMDIFMMAFFTQGGQCQSIVDSSNDLAPPTNTIFLSYQLQQRYHWFVVKTPCCCVLWLCINIMQLI